MKIETYVLSVSLLWSACGGEEAMPTSSEKPQWNATAGMAGLSMTVGGATATAPAAPLASTPPATSVPPAPPATAAAAPAVPAAPAIGGAAAPAPATAATAGAPAMMASAPAAAGAAAPRTGAPAPTPTAGAGTCPAGEMCQVSTVGGFKFCSAMMQALPPSCGAANSACGTDMKGMCLDAAAIGFSGTFCLHNTCM